MTKAELIEKIGRMLSIVEARNTRLGSAPDSYGTNWTPYDSGVIAGLKTALGYANELEDN